MPRRCHSGHACARRAAPLRHASHSRLRSLYNNIVQPSRLVAGADFHCFKEGVEPKWEDPQCATGGEWRAPVPKGDKKALDTFWLNTLLALIGEQFKEGGDICGVVVSVRKSQDRVCLWTKNAANEAVQMSIGQTFKETLELSPNAHLGFTTFHDQKTCVRGGDARARACAHTHEAPIAPGCHADAPRVRPFPPPPSCGLGACW